MSSGQLKHYIPIASAARREPVAGDEPELRLSLGFEPQWYHDRLGVDFSERWHLDPVYRYDSILAMRRHLHEHFPMVPEFTNVEERCATISGVHGIMVVPMLYGIEIAYRPDAYPDARTSIYVAKETLANLQPFDLTRHPVVVQLMQQMDVIERNWGKIDGYLNLQGVLNVAFRVRGPDIMIDLYDDPPFAEHLFSHIAGTILDLAKLIQARQRASGFAVNHLTVSNCVMNMISPKHYERFLLRYDRGFSQAFERFGVHTCEWDVTPYLDVLRKIEKMGYLDMGSMSDMKKVRRMFPDARGAVLLGPTVLSETSPEQARALIERIREELEPCDVVVGSIDMTVPDKKVLEYIRLVELVASRPRRHEQD